MIYKNTSVKEVIAKVFTDNDIQDGTHRISDMIEWAGEALERIGAFPQFVNKVTGKDDIPLLTISDYQAKLPSDFYKLIQVAYSSSTTGPFYPVRYATGSFDYGSAYNSEQSSTVDAQTVASTSDIVSLAMSLYNLDYDDALAKINGDQAVRELLSSMLTSSSTGTSAIDSNMDTTTDITYIITSGYIKTNVKDGYLMIAYQAIPTDTDGYPLIPDDASFKDALYWYITMKLLYPEWKGGRVRDAVYYDARRSWNYYSKQAYGNAMMPDQEQMESIKNTWNRLIPVILEHDSGFSTLGERQVIYNNN